MVAELGKLKLFNRGSEEIDGCFITHESRGQALCAETVITALSSLIFKSVATNRFKIVIAFWSLLSIDVRRHSGTRIGQASDIGSWSVDVSAPKGRSLTQRTIFSETLRFNLTQRGSRR